MAVQSNIPQSLSLVYKTWMSKCRFIKYNCTRSDTKNISVQQMSEIRFSKIEHKSNKNALTQKSDGSAHQWINVATVSS